MRGVSRGLDERAEPLQVDKVRKGILDRRERERVKEARKTERLQDCSMPKTQQVSVAGMLRLCLGVGGKVAGSRIRKLFGAYGNVSL